MQNSSALSWLDGESSNLPKTMILSNQSKLSNDGRIGAIDSISAGNRSFSSVNSPKVKQVQCRDLTHAPQQREAAAIQLFFVRPLRIARFKAAVLSKNRH
jgi:hypothetical protein